MQLKPMVYGPWPSGLDNIHRLDPDEGTATLAENTRFEESGAAMALHEPLLTGATDVAFSFDRGYVKDGTLYVDDTAVGAIGPGPYYHDSGKRGIVASGTHAYTLLPEPKELPRWRPAVELSTSPNGTLVGRTAILAMKDGVPSQVGYVWARAALIFTTPGASIFASRPDGAELYFAGVAGPDGGFDLTRTPEGAVLPADEVSREPVPLGGPVALVGSRLAVARGTILHYSSAFLTQVREPHNFLNMGRPIRMLAAVEDALFIGTSEGVQVVNGLGTNDMTLRDASNVEVFMSNSLRVPAQTAVSPEAPGEVAVWMSAAGIQIGSASGEVATPAASRISISGPTRGVLAYNGENFVYYGKR